MAITLQLELRMSLQADQHITRSLVPISHRQHVTGLLEARHCCRQEINNVTHVPVSDITF